MSDDFKASLSTLILSIGSSAAMALGLAPNPSSGKIEVDAKLAKFNIDLLVMLKEKTKGNLDEEEANFLTNMVGDLQAKYVDSTKAT